MLHATGAASITLSDFRTEMILDSVFGSLVSAALIPAIAHNINTGQSLGLGPALSAGFRRWGIVFVTRLSSGFRIGLGLILLIVPGVVVYLGLARSPADTAPALPAA